eukprot:9488985-Pyramimonas_sp.AAC.1
MSVRAQMVTLDPDTTEEGEEPLVILDTFRRGADIRPRNGHCHCRVDREDLIKPILPPILYGH